MPGLFPSLVGNVIIRERPSRHPNEPRYKRLDFVRPKPESDNSDSWPIIYSAEPVRGIQLYTPTPHYYQVPAEVYYQQYGQFPPGHVIHRVPAPPLTGGHAPKPKAIEARPAGSDSDDEDDGDHKIVKIVEAAIKKEKDKTKDKKKDKKKKEVRVVSSGHSIFADSDSESDYVSIAKTKRKVKRYYV